MIRPVFFSALYQSFSSVQNHTREMKLISLVFGLAVSCRFRYFSFTASNTDFFLTSWSFYHFFFVNSSFSLRSCRNCQSILTKRSHAGSINSNLATACKFRFAKCCRQKHRLQILGPAGSLFSRFVLGKLYFAKYSTSDPMFPIIQKTQSKTRKMK